MSARLVCQTWREASLAMKFVDQEALVLGRLCVNRFNQLNQVMDILQHSTRPFYHFVFIDMELKRNMPVWDRYGPCMKSLELSFCDLNAKTLVNILKCCHSLEVLSLTAYKQCLISEKLLSDENDIKELSEKFQNLRELNLSDNRFLNDDLFNKLVAICPNLKSICLMGCHISFHYGVYKKFYPQNRTTLPNASNSVLTFLNILHYFKQQPYKLKHLNFSFTSIDGTTLATLTTLQDLKLESLILQGCYQLTIEGIKSLAHQTFLKVLDISFCARVTDDSLLCICKNLTKLETLRIRKCCSVTDIGIQHIRLLRNLKELDISDVEQLTRKCITHGLCSNCGIDASTIEENIDSENFLQNKNLQMLFANALHLHEESIECISRCFPNLKLLELGYCFKGVTDKTIQMILEKLVRLQVLNITQCNYVSDAGLTGMGAGNHENVENTQDVYEPEFTETRLRIALRSKAEEEIVHDADQKLEVTNLCENMSRPLDLKTFCGFSLIRLKCLRELDLSGCYRITDVSLKHAFTFPELKILNLSQCEQVTHVGLDYLSRNNPAIEVLNLSLCRNISDIGISYLAQRLHRLKRLLIQTCSQLTDQSLESIRLYCKNLQYLDTRYCWGMTVTSIKNLKHLNIHWIKHTDENFPENEIPPPAPPLPSLPSLS
ncbi:uncharacterized protein LOC143151999 isoform X2 [Ptiloglossa arizonensis]